MSDVETRELSSDLTVAAAERVVSVFMHRRAEVGVAVVGADHGHVREVLAACERLIAGHPEFELLSTRTRVLDAADFD